MVEIPKYSTFFTKNVPLHNFVQNHPIRIVYMSKFFFFLVHFFDIQFNPLLFSKVAIPDPALLQKPKIPEMEKNIYSTVSDQKTNNAIVISVPDLYYKISILGPKTHFHIFCAYLFIMIPEGCAVSEKYHRKWLNRISSSWCLKIAKNK